MANWVCSSCGEDIENKFVLETHRCPPGTGVQFPQPSEFERGKAAARAEIIAMIINLEDQ